MARLSTLICALALATAIWPAASAAEPLDPAAWLFDPGAVVEIDFEIPEESIRELEAATQEDPGEYQPAEFTLRVDGVPQEPADVGIRLKGGFGSFRPFGGGKAAFKVKFNEFVKGQTFFGLKKLTLNNMVQDPSMIHEVLAYEAFRAVGVAAPRTGYAFVRVNEADYGIYLNVEALDSIALARWFDSTGHLYEGAYGVDAAPADVGAFEVDEGDDEDLQDLEALAAAAEDGDGDWSEGMDAVADLKQMTRMWAVERYVGHWDGYAGVPHGGHPNNYYLHSERNETLAPAFTMLPWGTDQTWDDHVPFDAEGGLLFNRCFADVSCGEEYRESLLEVRATAAALDFDARATELAELLEPWQARETEWPSHSPTEIADAVDAARAFIAGRPGELDLWLGGVVPDGPPAPEEAEAADRDEGVVQRHALKFGTPRAVGAVVSTRLVLPGAGRARQSVITRVNGRWRTVCSTWSNRGRAGPLTLWCRISSFARHRLAGGGPPLFARVGFTPVGGRYVSVLRQVTVAKRPRL